MREISEKIEKNWASLLNQRSQNYLVRSKIDQNIAIANSNLSASFMGNRQLANHNTADIKYNLTKIAENNLNGTDSERGEPAMGRGTGRSESGAEERV